MTDFHLQFPFCGAASVALIMAFKIPLFSLGSQPGGEELGRIEVFLEVAENLCGGYAFGFIYSWDILGRTREERRWEVE